jgi:exopolyphosphatase/guanosine-5'-triphosphate,3'-diphosphate pyrophosphatase
VTVPDLSAVVPRWEWRAWGDAVAGPAARLAGATPEAVHDSDEIYLVSRDGEDAVKVRDGLFDVKRLEEVGDDGLERWRPLMKRPSTLTMDDVRAFSGSLRLTEARAVAVRKHRRRFTIGGCAAELTDVTADGTPLRTFAIESEDRDAVIRARRDLGLEGHPNTSYPRMLARVAGVAGPRGAVIDVGTNSVKLHVAERVPRGWRTLDDRAVVTRLGEGLREGGPLAPAAVARTVDAVCDLVREARRAGAGDVVAVGTAGLRMASDPAALTDAVRERSGVAVEVIGGEEESRLGYLAATAAAGPASGTVLVFETGGGSSQFTFGAGDRIDERFSIDVGAVGLTERFGLAGRVSPAVLVQARAFVTGSLGRLAERPRPDALVGIGGALTNLAAVRHGLARYDPAVVEGTVLDLAEIDRQIERYRALTADERRGITGLQPGRAEVILAGALVVRAVLDALGRHAITVSDRGLRHALLSERFAAGGDGAGP